jgi:hypothetical protein
MLDIDSARTREHLVAEAQYAESELRTLAPVAAEVATEMRSRYIASQSAPATPHGPWWYYTRRPADGDYLQYWRSDVDPATAASPRESLLLDGNALATELGGFSLGPFRVSPDHRRLAYGVDPTGNERFVLRFRDLESGEDLPDVLLGTHYTCAWSAAGDQVLYVTADDANRPHRVWRHRLGTSQSDDELVLEEPDTGVWLTVGSTRSGQVLFIRGAAHTSTEFHVLDAHTPENAPRLIRRREKGIYYEIDHREGPQGGDPLRSSQCKRSRVRTCCRQDGFPADLGDAHPALAHQALALGDGIRDGCRGVCADARANGSALDTVRHGHDKGVARGAGRDSVPRFQSGLRRDDLSLLAGHYEPQPTANYALEIACTNLGAWVSPRHLELSELAFDATGRLVDPYSIDAVKRAIAEILAKETVPV